MSETLANIAVILATISTASFLLPQIVKLVRTRNTAGVSTTWPALGFAINVGWFTYMISQQLWVSIAPPFITFVAYAVTLWALRRAGRDIRAPYVRGLAAAVILVGVAIVGGWEVLGIALGLSYGVVSAPSVWTAYRTSDPSGIAPLTWWIGAVEALLWGSFGWYHSDRGIITFMVVGVTASTLMLLRYYATRNRVEDLEPSLEAS
ncbi:MAG: PQ-loop domain-containing transporter [Acidimicrobiia bacterium]|nr:PQ-loop domain-containing transporter [Acidimicrobiia bacterium]